MVKRAYLYHYQSEIVLGVHVYFLITNYIEISAKEPHPVFEDSKHSPLLTKERGWGGEVKKGFSCKREAL